MTTNTYITLANSNASISKKFRVVQGTLAPVINRTQNRRRTLTGKSDNQVGQSFESVSMTLRVHTQNDTGYGLLSDLLALYSVTDAWATPSNQISYTDHLGTTTTVEFVGTLTRDNLTPYLDGPDAAYLIQIQLEAVN